MAIIRHSRFELSFLSPVLHVVAYVSPHFGPMAGSVSSGLSVNVALACSLTAFAFGFGRNHPVIIWGLLTVFILLVVLIQCK